MRSIDVLLVDSLDTADPWHADHAPEEVRAAQGLLHARSYVAFDDTFYGRRMFHGKECKAVPWLLEREWRIRYFGVSHGARRPGRLVGPGTFDRQWGSRRRTVEGRPHSSGAEKLHSVPRGIKINGRKPV